LFRIIVIKTFLTAVFISIIVLVTGFPYPVHARVSEEKLLQKALSKAQAGKYSHSKKLFLRLLKRNPKKGVYWFNLGNIYFLQKKYRSSIKMYKKVLRLKSPLSVPAKFYIAKSQHEAGKLKLAAKLLNELKRERLPNSFRAQIQAEEDEILAKIRFNMGMVAYKQNNYPIAVSFFRESVEAKSTSDRLMMLGLAQLRTYNTRGARASLKKVKKMAREKELSENAGKFLDQIREGSWDPTRKVFPFLNFGVGYDSNFSAVASEDIPKKRVIYRAHLGVVHLLTRRGNFRMSNNYALSSGGPVNIPDDRFVGYRIGNNMRYQLNPWIFGLSPGFKQDFIWFRKFLMTPSIGLNALRFWSYHEVGFNYRYSYRIANDSDFDYLGKARNRFTLFWGTSVGKFNAKLDYSIIVNSAEDLISGSTRIPIGSTSYIPGLNLVWIVNKNWEIESEFTYTIKNYNRTLLPGDIERKDKRSNYFLSVTRNLDREISAYISADYVINRSSLGSSSGVNKNYNELVGFVGLVWKLIL